MRNITKRRDTVSDVFWKRSQPPPFWVRSDFGSAPAAPERAAWGLGVWRRRAQKSEPGGRGVDRKNPTGRALGAEGRGGEGVSPACWNFSPGNSGYILLPPRTKNKAPHKNISALQCREGQYQLPCKTWLRRGAPSTRQESPRSPGPTWGSPFHSALGREKEIGPFRALLKADWFLILKNHF